MRQLHDDFLTGALVGIVGCFLLLCLIGFLLSFSGFLSVSFQSSQQTTCSADRGPLGKQSEHDARWGGSASKALVLVGLALL